MISVNIGGWVVTEPVSFCASYSFYMFFLFFTFSSCEILPRVLVCLGLSEFFSSPALYQKYSSNPTPPVDEWTLCQAMRADTSGGGIDQLETHYKTFIVCIFYFIAFSPVV